MIELEKYIRKNREAFDNDHVSAEFDLIFEKRLQSMNQSQKRIRPIYLRYAGVAALLLLAIVITRINGNNFLETQTTEILESLSANSAGDRLIGIHKFNELYKKENQRIIEAVISIMHNDDNTNARIAAIKSLVKFQKNEVVRTSLIDALENEKKPLVQIELIRTLSFLEEKRAHPIFENVIKDPNNPSVVVNNAISAINNLK